MITRNPSLKFVKALYIAAACGWIFSTVSGEVRLPALFSDGMVLQRQQPIPVWGWADPGEEIKIRFRKQTVTTAARNDGKWEILLEAEAAGGPDTLVVEGSNLVQISDVLVGEVWLCSGQSNMAWPVNKSLNAELEIRTSDFPRIRLFTVERLVAETPQTDVKGRWTAVSPETVGDFSAVGFFFGRYLHTHLDVPVGLIHSSWGGTPAESWMRVETLRSNMDYAPILERFDAAIRDYPAKKAGYEAMIQRMERGEEVLEYHKDPGNTGLEKGWSGSDFDDSSWNSVELPATWESARILDGDGAVWFRKSIEIPPDWSGKPLVLSLGPIDDFDVTYFNGEEIGYTDEEMPNYSQYNRHYLVPEELVRPGPAVIAVRVFDRYGRGGFTGNAEQMKIWPEREKSSISLAENWKYHVEIALDPYAVTGPGGGRPRPPMGPDHPHRPGGLYNGMIHPLAPFAIRGVIWYQGESNLSRAYQYRSLLADLINDWRMLWRRYQFYFGIVQLANFRERVETPGESEWAELREAQALVARSVPRAWLAVTIDIGEADDIHPKNKQDVGKRLALWPLKHIYHQKLVASGPELAGYMIWGANHVALEFRNTAGRLTSGGRGPIRGFTVAGSDRKFYPATAEYRDRRIVLRSEEVPRPVAVRYGWADNPDCTLYNAEGLPAIPFRTDNWPGITINIR